MKCLIVTAVYPKIQDGIGDGSEVLFNYFKKKNIDVWLFTQYYPETENYISNLTYKDNVFMIKNWKIRYKNIIYLFSILKKHKIDTVHIEYPGLYKRGLFITIIPFLLFLYNTFKSNKIQVLMRLHEFKKVRLIRRISTIPMILFSSHVFIPSYNDYLALKKKYKKKIIKTNIGINVPLTKTKESFSKQLTVGYFGFIYKYKGIEKLIETFRVIHNYDNEIKFLIIGKLDLDQSNPYLEYHKKIIQLIEDSGLKDLISITGYVQNDQVENEICSIDVAILPFEDGLSLRRGSFISFLLHGVYIVTTEPDFESARLFENALGISLGSFDTITERSLDVIKNKKIYENGADNIRYSATFNWDDIIDNMLSFYQYYKKRIYESELKNDN